MINQKKAEIGTLLMLNDRNNKLVNEIKESNEEHSRKLNDLLDQTNAGTFERHLLYIQSLNNYGLVITLYEDIQAILEEENRDLRQQVRSLKNEIENLQDKIDDMTEPSDEGMEQTLEEM